MSRTKVPWAIHQGSHGGRNIELPWMHRFLAAFVGRVADFGVCGDGGMCTTPQLHLTPECEVTCFDRNAPADMPYRFVQWDFTKRFPESFRGYFDLGIALSTIEHIGLSVYGNTPIPGDDRVSFNNIFETIRPGGALVITVPASAEDFVHPCGWLRSYSVDALKGWCPAGASLALELYERDVQENAWYAVEAIDPQVRHQDDINGIAIATYTKGAGNV